MGRRRNLARARTSVDMGRVANAVSRPGIDPRIWLTLAVVKDVGYDPDEGIFVDVQFQPTGEIETCLLGAPYAGAEFGGYFPVNVDDTVLVAVPSGDPATGPILITRLWNAGDKPHADFQDPDDENEATQDVVLRIQPGRKLKIRTSDEGDGIDITVEGDGNVLIQATGDGKVLLGGAEDTEPSTLGTTLKNFLTSLRDDVNTALLLLQTHIHTGGTISGNTGPITPLTTPLTYPVPLDTVPNIEASEVEVK